MVDDEEWDWIVRVSTQGDFDHLLIGHVAAALLAAALHFLEAWNEAVCDGAWGSTAARVGEKHPPGPSTSSTGPRSATRSARRWSCSSEVARGRHGERRAGDDRRCSPATSTTPTSPRSHFARATAAAAPVYQAVCSPFRNPLDSASGARSGSACPRSASASAAALARAAGVEPRAVDLEDREGPWFDNQVAHLEHGRRGKSVFRIEKALGAGDEDPHLEEVCVRRLA